MATKAELVAELKTYPAYKDIKETVLMRDLKATLEQKLAEVKGVSMDELKVETAPKKTTKTTTRKTTKKSAKIDFDDDELDKDLLNNDSLVDSFYEDEFEDFEDDLPF
jgi:hypothetical protein